jgi:hypothetical protein
MIDAVSFRARIGCFQHKCFIFRLVRSKRNKTEDFNHSASAYSIFRMVLLFSLVFGIVCSTPSTCTKNIKACHYAVSNLDTVLIDCVQPVVSLQASRPVPSDTFSFEDQNFLARYKFGNRREHGMKLVHWNKGPSFLASMLPDTEASPSYSWTIRGESVQQS